MRYSILKNISLRCEVFTVMHSSNIAHIYVMFYVKFQLKFLVHVRFHVIMSKKSHNYNSSSFR